MGEDVLRARFLVAVPKRVESSSKDVCITSRGSMAQTKRRVAGYVCFFALLKSRTLTLRFARSTTDPMNLITRTVISVRSQGTQVDFIITRDETAFACSWVKSYTAKRFLERFPARDEDTQ